MSALTQTTWVEDPLDSLSEQLTWLSGQVESIVTQNAAIIAREAARLMTTRREFCVFELTPQAILVTSRVPSAAADLIEVQLGFPFRLASLTSNQPCRPGTKSRICLRGGSLRQVQRKQLEEISGLSSRLLSTADFEATAATLAMERTRVAYVNPHTYLGDSFIGEYMRDRFVDHYRSRSDGYYSRFPEQLGAIDGIRDIQDLRRDLTSDHLVLMPCFIDTHLEFAGHVIRDAISSNAPVLLFGRNTIVWPGKGEIYQAHDPDPLLRASNIEDFMDDCIGPFIGHAGCGDVRRPPATGQISLEHVLVNSFASLAIRDLPPQMVANAVEALVKQRSQRITISNGVATAAKDQDSIRRVKDALREKYLLDRVEFRSFSDLTELTEFASKSGVSCCISPDTSVPHLMNTVSVPAVTFYNLRFWDGASLQSLAGDSPLGFCRYHSGQIPILFDSLDPLGTPAIEALLAELARGARRRDGSRAETYLSLVRDLGRAPASDLPKLVQSLQSLHDELSCDADLKALATGFPISHFTDLLVRHGDAARRHLQSLFRISPVFKLAGATDAAS